MRIKTLGVIPARLASTRLPEKVLAPIQGRPMIQHVWERACQAKRLDGVIVACDDVRIADCVEGFGGRAVLTRADHPNGSSRVAEVVLREAADVFINIQADEPMIHPEGIDQLAASFSENPHVEAATLAVRRIDDHDYQNPNVVKVVTDTQGDALYFSRSPIPYFREKGREFSYLKHLGIYGYRKNFLLQFVHWRPGLLEEIEKLEQLRILERGFSIRVVQTPYDSFSVDTEEDLKAVENKLRELKIGAV